MAENPLDAVIFKSNADAFAYACQYLDNSLEDERAVLGYVLAVEDEAAIVKFANDLRPELPTGNVESILELADLETISYGAQKIDKVGNLKPGDLVMIIALKECVALGKPGLGAVIVDKVKPVYVLSKGGWQLFPIEH